MNGSSCARIGIIAGSGPEAGLDMWAKVLDANRRLLGDRYRGDRDAPTVTIISKPTLGYSTNPYDDAHREAIWVELQEAVLRLAEQADVIAIACNTLYVYADRIEALRLGAELVSPVSCVRDMARRRGLSSVALLGTRVVTDLDGISPYAALRTDIEVERTKLVAELDRVLAAVKLAGRSTPEIERDFAAVVESLASPVVLLACTELPLVRLPPATTHDFIDVTQLVADELAARALRLPQPSVRS